MEQTNIKSRNRTMYIANFSISLKWHAMIGESDFNKLLGQLDNHLEEDKIGSVQNKTPNGSEV